MDSLPQVPATFYLLFEFRHLFRRGTFESFVTLFKGWVLCQGRRTISQAIKAAGKDGQAKQFASFYYFFSRASWDEIELGFVVFMLVLTYVPESIVVLIDDTLCEKTGPHLFGGGVHHDSHRSTYGRFTSAGRRVAFAFGWNYVVTAIHVPLPWNKNKGVAIPVLVSLYRSKKTCPPDLYEKRTTIAAGHIKQIEYWLAILDVERKVFVAVDSEYSCGTVCDALPDGWHLVGRMPAKAALFALPKPEKRRGPRRKKGERLPSPKDIMADETNPWVLTQVDIYGRSVAMYVKSMVGLWYSVTGAKPIMVIMTRDPNGRIDDRVYFTTDPTMTVSAALRVFACRWAIEVTFRNVKQHLGLGDPQNGWGKAPRDRMAKKKAGPQARGERGAAAVQRTVPFIFTVYGLLYILYFNHGDPERDVAEARRVAPWYTHKTEPSFEDILRAARWELLLHEIQRYPLPKRVDKYFSEVLCSQLHAA